MLKRHFQQPVKGVKSFVKSSGIMALTLGSRRNILITPLANYPQLGIIPQRYITHEKNYGQEAFMKTNTINSAWWRNEEITPMFAGNSCRSTSVGDVVVVDEKKFECEPVGWKQL